MPSFSVVVPFRDTEAHIEGCVRGLLAQDYPSDRVELLFVDNASSDRSADILRAHPEVTLLAEPTVGAYAARNAGARRAAGEIIAFTDPDCVADPGWLRALADAMEEPEIEVVIGPAPPGGRSTVMRSLAAYDEAKETYILSSSDPELYWGRGGNLAVRRDTWSARGPFLARERGSDVLFVREVVEARSCYAVRYAPRAGVTHREVLTVTDYLRKAVIYAMSRRRYSRVRAARALTNAERTSILRSTVSELQLSRIDSARFAAVLFAGWLCWGLGSLAGSLPSQRTSTQPPVQQLDPVAPIRS
jgi:glycosyltransferase involved in cell wall biosynthesis